MMPPCFVLRKGPSMPRRNWSIRREEPSIAITADLRPFVTHTGLAFKYSVTHSSSMKGPGLNFHAERELAHPKTTSFSSFLQLQYPHVRRRRVVCRYSKKQVTHRQLVLRYRYCTLLSCRRSRGEMTSIPRNARYVVKKSSRKSRRCRKHGRTSPYTSARDFPVLPSLCRVWRFHLVVE